MLRLNGCHRETQKNSAALPQRRSACGLAVLLRNENRYDWIKPLGARRRDPAILALASSSVCVDLYFHGSIKVGLNY